MSFECFAFSKCKHYLNYRQKSLFRQLFSVIQNYFLCFKHIYLVIFHHIAEQVSWNEY